MSHGQIKITSPDYGVLCAPAKKEGEPSTLGAAAHPLHLRRYRVLHPTPAFTPVHNKRVVNQFETLYVNLKASGRTLLVPSNKVGRRSPAAAPRARARPFPVLSGQPGGRQPPFSALDPRAPDHRRSIRLPPHRCRVADAVVRAGEQRQRRSHRAAAPRSSDVLPDSAVHLGPPDVWAADPTHLHRQPVRERNDEGHQAARALRALGRGLQCGDGISISAKNATTATPSTATAAALNARFAATASSPRPRSAMTATPSTATVPSQCQPEVDHFQCHHVSRFPAHPTSATPFSVEDRYGKRDVGFNPFHPVAEL